MVIQTPGSSAVICRMLEVYHENKEKNKIKMEVDRPLSGFCSVLCCIVSRALAIIQAKPNKETCLLAESCLK